MNLHEKVRYTREYKKVKRKVLAEQLNISISYLTHMESGIRKIKLDILEKIAHLLNIPLGFYVTDIAPTIDDYIKKYNAFMIQATPEKYGEYLKVLDLAIDEGISPEEFSLYLKLRRNIVS